MAGLDLVNCLAQSRPRVRATHVRVFPHKATNWARFGSVGPHFSAQSHECSGMPIMRARCLLALSTATEGG